MIRLVAIGGDGALALEPGAVAREPDVSRETPTTTIRVDGPLVSGDDCWWGGVSSRQLQHAIHEAAEAGLNVHLEIDSPGGDVSGIVELVESVWAARSKVRVTAYVRGLCASAAYWLASACESIECAATAIVGQIGAQLVIYDPPDASEHMGVRTVVTSVGSERKNASPRVDAEQYQALVDAAAAQFIAGVARGRGVDEATVRDGFGRGALLPAADALALGMIDAVRGAAGGDSMARLKAEDMAPAEAPAPEMTPEEMGKLIEDLRRQLADQAAKIAEMESACKPEAEAGTDVPDSPADPEDGEDPALAEVSARVSALEAENARLRMTAAIDSLVDRGQLPPAQRAKAEKAYRLAADAKAGKVDKFYATAWDEFVAELKPHFGRVSAAGAGVPVTAGAAIVARAEAIMAETKIDRLEAMRMAEREVNR